jgi:Ca2+-binding RTX toxin-like protein
MSTTPPVTPPITELEYAGLSGYAHFAKRTPENLPDAATLYGFHEKRSDRLVDEANGFEGTILTRGNQVVVAFAGTIDWVDLWEDITLFLGSGTQIASAARLYMYAVNIVLPRLKAQGITDPQISFTGHSLGGGIASVMAVLFNKPAMVFDSAPFMAQVNKLAPIFEVHAALAAAGFHDAELDRYALIARGFDPTLSAFYSLADAEKRLAELTENVHGSYKKGEFITAWFPSAARINANAMTMIDLGHVDGTYHRDNAMGKSEWDLHTGTLMVANYLDSRFAEQSRRFWHFIPEIFDSKVEERGYLVDPPSFLEKVSFSPTRGGNLLKGFLDDIAKIQTNVSWADQEVDENYAPTFGDGVHWADDVSSGTVDRAQPVLQGLIKTAINYYASFDASTPSPAPLFKGGDASIKVDAALLNSAGVIDKQGPQWIRSYVSSRLNERSNASKIDIGRFDTAGQWVLPTQSGSGLASDSSPWQQTFVMGSLGNDLLVGGVGTDVMFGDWGDDILLGADHGEDVLDGGRGDDQLYGNELDKMYGGQGEDHYVVKVGGEIEDSDGQGDVRFNDVLLTQGWHMGPANIYTDYANSVIYYLTDDKLTIKQGGDSTPLTIYKWKNGDLGITLHDKDADPANPRFPDIYKTPPRKDPLILDLDGDGVETTGPNDPARSIYFDASGAGIPTLTGWVKADDAFLTLDRNGNGRIDSGQELFGDATPLAFGGSAIDGFDALAQEDTNSDGWVDAADARFADLRLWRDLDQDGVSDPGELFSLAEVGVEALRVSNSGNRQELDNGNRIADLGSFRWADGHSGSSAVVGNAADVDLAQDLSRQNLPPIVVNPAVLALPQMLGRGRVYDLHSAATLSPDLAAQLAAYTTLDRVGQQAAIDGLIHAWASSSDMTPLRERAEAMGVDVVYEQFQRPTHYYYPRPNERPFQSWIDGGSASAEGWLRGDFAPAVWTSYVDYFESRIFSLEAMSGTYFQVLPGESSFNGSLPGTVRIDGAGEDVTLHVTWDANHLGLALQARYENMRQQIYETLAEQTRLATLLAPLSDSALSTVEAFNAVQALLRSAIAADRMAGIGDLIDVNAIMQRRFGNDARWGGAALLADSVAAQPLTPELIDLLTSWRVSVGEAGAERNQGAPGSYTFVPLSNALAQTGHALGDWMVGTHSADRFDGAGGDDWLQGRGGNDQLFGGDGKDLIDGGTGNDILGGGGGGDQYRFDRGDGNDLIVDTQGSNTLVLGAGLVPADLTFNRQGSELLISVRDSGDSLRVQGFFNASGGLTGNLGGIDFASGAFIDSASLAELVALGDGRAQTIDGTLHADAMDAGGGNDNVHGFGGGDSLRGGEGRDTLDGGEGDDLLEGGDDKDLLLGGAGNDTLEGGASADTLEGGAGDDVLHGGRGRDRLTGGAGYDRYDFNLGDGVDTIVDAGQSGAGEAVRFGAGIHSAQLRVARQGDNLVLQVGDSADRVLLSGWFAAGALPIDRFEFADGTLLNGQQLRSRLGEITGGDAVLSGTTGADTLQGGAGNDLLSGGDGNDQLVGGAGVDQLLGGAGSDILDGGPGNDVLSGGDGSDTIRFGPGAGSDTWLGVDSSSGRVDRVLLGPAVRSLDLLLFRAGNDLLLTLRGQPDQLRVVDHFAPASGPRLGSGIDRIDFSDGTRWSLAQIATKAAAWTGAALGAVPVLLTPPVPVPPAALDLPPPGVGDDQALTGSEGDDPALQGGEGDDTLRGLGGQDALRGGAGQDALDGGAGDDTLAGDSGQDAMQGGLGSDTYRYARGDGSDTVTNQDTADSTDRLQLLGVAAADVLARREGLDLLLYIGAPGQRERARETGDAIRLSGFFAPGGAGRIDGLEFDSDPAWSADELARRAQSGTEFDDVLLLGDADEVVDALGGHDLVLAGAGSDSINGGSGADALYGEAGDDTLAGGSEADILDGGDGRDALSGDAGDDQLSGGAGDDLLTGGAGNDALDGGAGDDVLRGGLGGGAAGSGAEGLDLVRFGAGQDLLRVGLDDGEITLDARDPAAREADVLRFDAGIAPADVQISRYADDLLLTINNGPVVRVSAHFAGSGETASTLEQIEFASDAGTIWTAAQLRLRSLTATPGNDALFGFDANETIDGLAGDDAIDGRAGDDTLIGNTGNDRLSGGEGADRYVFNPGWGHDTLGNADSVPGRDEIVFGPGVDPASLTVRRSYSDLLISGPTDSLRVLGFFVAEGVSGNAPARIVFSDAPSTSWDLAAIQARALLGTPGDDRIVGHATPDLIIGGAGDDVLDGGGASDTYVFARGFGHDRIDNTDAARSGDRIRFAADIALADVTVSRSNNDLWLRVGSDSVQVQGYFNDGALAAWRLAGVSFDSAPGTEWDRAQLLARASLATEGDDVYTGTPDADVFDALGGNDRLLGDEGDDNLNGGPGADTLQGGGGADTLHGGIGSDDLYGDAGDDSLDGGPGDDILDGGAGRDAVRLAVGGGRDWLNLAAEADWVDASGLRQSELRITRQGNDLLITIIASGDSLLVQGQFGGAPRVDLLQMADGALDGAGIALASMGATAGDDQIYGTASDDVIDGLAGNDTLFGLAGNDRLIGGPGNDTLSGGPGNDVVVFDLGGGADSVDATDTGVGRIDAIELGIGITPASVSLRRERSSSDDLVLKFNASDSLWIRNFFALGDGLGASGVQQVRFADGTVWSTEDLRLRTLLGGAGADTLLGYASDDWLVGGPGDDKLDGATGSDVYLYAVGDGHDTIEAYDPSAGRIDTLRLGAGIAPADLTLRRVPSNTPIQFLGQVFADDLLIDLSAAAGGGSVRVRQFFHQDGDGALRIDRIEFADGAAAMDHAALLAAVRLGTPGDDVIHGTANADTLDGMGGNDAIFGEAGDDTLVGGLGNDTLDGGAGNDSYRFASGFGSDTINADDPGVGKFDSAVFDGISRAQVTFSRDAADLFVTLTATGDRLRVAGAFLVEDQNARQVDRFVFTDQELTHAQVRALLFTPTSGPDTLYGSGNSDDIDALAGNDTVHAAGGNDKVQGGPGNDSLYGEGGSDTLDGGAGDDLLVGGADAGSDSYRFGNGRGADRVDATVPGSTASLDRVLIDADLTPAQISLLRSGPDLVLTAPDGGTLRLLGFFTAVDAGQLGRVTNVQFADAANTNWDTAYLRTHSGGGTEGPDVFIGDAGDNEFYLLGGDDYAYGRAGNDFIDGGAGRDRLYGESGNDTLDGGAADHAADSLDGYIGDDTYVFGVGDGADTVFENVTGAGGVSGGTDRVLFRANLTPANIGFRRQGDDLYVLTGEVGDSLRISSWFSAGSRIESFEFADGTVWGENEVLAHQPGATEGNDYLTGTNGPDTLDALGGHDRVYGRGGDDLIFGGAGGDYLNGEAGDDTLHGGEELDYLTGGAGNDQLHGDAGNDTLESGGGNDVLEGGAGDDQLRGSDVHPGFVSGDTLYRFASGWGRDTLSDVGAPGSTDTLEFFGGVTPDQLTLRRETTGSAAALTLRGSPTMLISAGTGAGTNSIRVFNQDVSGSEIEQIRFLDAVGAVSETWNAARIAAELLRPTAGNDLIAGSAAGEALTGEAGNDTLIGGAGGLFGSNDGSTGSDGPDTYDGGSGDDLLIGGYAADSYRFAAGFGQDTVRDRGANRTAVDELVFDGLAAADFTFSRSGDDLLLQRDAAPGDRVKVEGYFTFDFNWGAFSRRIERFVFSDTTLSHDGILARMTQGTEGDDVITGTEGNDVFNALGGNDIVRGQGGNDVIDGGNGDDTLEGGAGNDALLGGAGNDTLYDGSASGTDPGNDTLDGGAGSDKLSGGLGADIYRFGVDSQWAWDEVQSWSHDSLFHNDQLQLVGGITPAQTTLQRYGPYDLRIVIGEAGVVSGTELTSVRVLYQFNSVMTEMGSIRFDDGTAWDSATIAASAQRTTRYADWVHGTDATESFDGGDGADNIQGNGGDDTLHGGGGNDFVQAWDRHGSLFGDDGDDELRGGLLAEGGAGNDRIFWASTQRGGPGDDALNGSSVDNTYHFDLGDGSDTLTDLYGGDTDVLAFGAGIGVADLALMIEGPDVVVDVGTAGDRIRIVDALAGYTIERLDFADGSSSTLAELLVGLIVGTDGDDVLFGTDAADRIYALGGADEVLAGGGDDQLDGGTGNDTLNGGDGSDLLVGGEGDDALHGGSAAGSTDTLDGGAGNDALYGQVAATRYLFGRGDGMDTVEDDDGGELATDVLQLDAGLAPAELSLRRETSGTVGAADDLIVRINDTTEEIRFLAWYADGDRTGIESLEFRDGAGALTETWDRARLALEAGGGGGGGGGPVLGTEGDDTRVLGDDADHFDALGGNDQIEGRGGNDWLIGGAGADKLLGDDGDDTLDGSGGGYDELDGGTGNDVLISAEGDGFFNGSNDADSYRIGAGDGNRFIFDFDGNGDTVEVAAVVDPSTLVFEADANSLHISRSDAPGWALTLWGMLDPAFTPGGIYANGSDGPIETLRLLSDGSTLDAAQMRARLPAGAWLRGSDGVDDLLSGDGQRNSIWGQAGHDTLNGGAGDDWLYGGAGGDDVTGGTGDDWLDDQDGAADTYRFARGDGADMIADRGEAAAQDRLVFGPGIVAADVSVHLDGVDSIRFEIAGAGGAAATDRIVVIAWRQADVLNKIERVEFDNGTVWTAADIDAFLDAGTVLPLALARSGELGTSALGGVSMGLSMRGIADAVAGFAADSADEDDGGARQRFPSIMSQERW